MPPDPLRELQERYSHSGTQLGFKPQTDAPFRSSIQQMCDYPRIVRSTLSPDLMFCDRTMVADGDDNVSLVAFLGRSLIIGHRKREACLARNEAILFQPDTPGSAGARRRFTFLKVSTAQREWESRNERPRVPFFRLSVPPLLQSLNGDGFAGPALKIGDSRTSVIGPVITSVRLRQNSFEFVRRQTRGTSMILARRIIAALVPLLLLFNCLPTTAATIVKAPGRAGKVVVSVSGELAAGDENRFVQTAGTVADGVVVFDSPGGNLLAGIEIGEVIHFKHFRTLVPNGNACASACALAWLGGATRLIGATGRIGFHQPYIRNSGVVSVSASLNAAVRAYLNELGLSAVAIQYLTETPPEKVKWLGFLEARRVGIEVFRAGQPP